MAEASGGRRRWVQHVARAEEAGWTVAEVLRGPLGVSGRMVQRLTRSGGISLNGRPTHLSRKVRAGDRIGARLADAEKSRLAPVELPLDIVFEDEDLLALNKPPFLLVHPTSPTHQGTLAHGVAHHLMAAGGPARVRPVHRIDRDTSGLVLFAKSAHAHHRMDLELREGRVEREYVAVVEGTIAGEAGDFREPIGRHPRDSRLRAVREDGSPAHTHFQVVERFPIATRLALWLGTGRTHQIRVHAAHAGHPVLGDRQYGAREPLLERPALHSARLSFTHPFTGARLSLEAPLAPDLRQLLERLRGGDGR